MLFVSEGVVLAKRGVGEANVLVYVLTKEFGLLRAVAKSARVEKSKLRYGLEPLTTGIFSFVRGRYEWKVTGIHRHSSRILLSTNPVRRRAQARVLKLLLRLVQGEEENRSLYQAIADGLALLRSAENQADADAVEIVLVLRILSHLGYLPSTPQLAPFMADPLFSIEMRAAVARSRAQLIRAINTSLESTGL